VSEPEAAGGESERAAAAPQVPDFDLLRRIGQGGFGQVWLAANRATGHWRAVKLIPLHGRAADPAGREVSSLIRLEAKLRHQHPNLVGIHHVGRTDRFLFYVMELADDVSGGPSTSAEDYQPATLEARLRFGPLPADDCLACCRQLLAGLTSLHEAGMVHRDVKPANCLFVGGTLKLADFGLLTDVGPLVSRVGTETYMPPDGHMDAGADVYAAGLVLYEMLTGLPAGSFPRLDRRAQAIADDVVLTGLLQVALRACHPDPHERFADAGQMLEALPKDEEPAHSAVRGPRRRTVLGLIAVGVVFAGAIGLWAVWPKPEPPRVYVNFITDPPEATILLDGKLVEAEGEPYRTPCTVEDLPARLHRVAFRHEERGLPQFEAGERDFAEVRQITARWKTTAPQSP
jgi:serine/threonine protein kinase